MRCHQGKGDQRPWRKRGNYFAREKKLWDPRDSRVRMESFLSLEKSCFGMCVFEVRVIYFPRKESPIVFANAWRQKRPQSLNFSNYIFLWSFKDFAFSGKYIVPWLYDDPCDGTSVHTTRIKFAESLLPYIHTVSQFLLLPPPTHTSPFFP